MSIIITGATGHFGSAVIKHLQQHIPPSEIIALARDLEKARAQFADSGVEVRYGDYDEPVALTGAFSGASKLLFVSSPDYDNTNRVVQHANVVKAARDAGVKHIFYTSFAFAEESKLPLALLHLTTEYAIRVSDIPYTFLRNPLYSDVFINQSLVPAIENGELVTNTGTGELNTVSRDDLAKAAAAALAGTGHENKVYNLTSSKTWSFDKLADVISDVTGKTVKHRAASYDEQLAYLKEAGLPESAAAFTAFMYQAISEGETARTSTDLEQLIGEEMPFEQFVKLAVTQ